jgi:hypothetical protein
LNSKNKRLKIMKCKNVQKYAKKQDQISKKIGDPTCSNKDDSRHDKSDSTLDKGKSFEIEKNITPGSLRTVVPHGTRISELVADLELLAYNKIN